MRSDFTAAHLVNVVPASVNHIQAEYSETRRSCRGHVTRASHDVHRGKTVALPLWFNLVPQTLCQPHTFEISCFGTEKRRGVSLGKQRKLYLNISPTHRNVFEAALTLLLQLRDKLFSRTAIEM